MINGHSQEPTSFSVTDTVVERSKGVRRPTALSPFTGTIDGLPLERSSPDPFTADQKPLPVREETLDPRLALKTIPPEHSHRTLILCFDGTGDQFDADNSNVVHLVSMLRKNDRTKQMVYYQVST